MSLISVSVDPKAEGIDPKQVADILAQVDAVVKRVNWLTIAAESILTQLAAKFHFDLPPQP